MSNRNLNNGHPAMSDPENQIAAARIAAQQAAAQAAQQRGVAIIPTCRILYRQHPSGVRTFEGLEVGGQLVGGLVSVDTGMDVSQPLAANVPPTLMVLTIKVNWPWEYKNVDDREVLIATGPLPEPPNRKST